MSESNKRPLNVGLVGGSSGFIVNAHQRAIFMDGTRRIVAGALSSRPERALAAANDWPYRIRGYESFDAMVEGELALPAEKRIDYVVILTPDYAHFEPAKRFLEAGIPVLCEKPLTMDSVDSVALRALVDEKKIPFSVAHTYLGHWTSRLARFIVRSGLLGEIRWVDSSYLQSHQAIRSTKPGYKESKQPFSPETVRAGNCGLGIGTHALMQLRYVTGLEVERLSAHLESFVEKGLPEGYEQDDHFTVYCQLSNGGRGMVRASQIAIGRKNDMRIEVNGDRGSVRWSQENSDKLVVNLIDQPERIYWRGGIEPNDGFLKDLPQELLDESTIPWGHSEGFHDAFARLHRCFEADVRAYQTGNYSGTDGSKYATADDGVVGVRFVEKAVESDRSDGAWVAL